jgi:hypothetical protein
MFCLIKEGFCLRFSKQLRADCHSCQIILLEICQHTNFAAHGKAAIIIIREYRHSF